MQRIPKLKGFKNPFRVAYTPVNIGVLAGLEGDEFTVQTMIDAGLCRPKDLVKVLGQGSLDRARSGCRPTPSRLRPPPRSPRRAVALRGCHSPSAMGVPRHRATP